jgi:hypothetical protein
LFELAPVHDLFVGNLGQPAWKVDDKGICFGNEQDGVSFRLAEGLMWGRFGHVVSEKNEVAYSSSNWRGNWSVDLTIDEIEVWTDT